jgi:23S rRNA (uracil1939-C5)-methyltransferase
MQEKLEEVTIEKMIHGGQGLATLADGRKVFVWGALPGERVAVRLIKQKNSYAEAIAEAVLEASPQRIPAREANYLATSPWQIIPLAAENEYKKQIVQELFQQAHVALPDFVMTSAGDDWHYRNKMEYSFWGDDDGMHLALHSRGSHTKTIVQGSELALPAIDRAANGILEQLRQVRDLRAGNMKTVMVRCSQDGQAVVSLFTKQTRFPKLALPKGVKGLRVYHSNPRSPASVPTKLLYELGDGTLQDKLLGEPFMYDVDSFFQVNIPVYEAALKRMREHVQAPDGLVDMYAGVGTIGLSIAQKVVKLVELDPATAAMARINAKVSPLDAEVVESSSEKATEHISGDLPVIFDPPRAGLHDKVTQATLVALPPQIIYLSCNPATQARDLALLADKYEITCVEGFNFFPHTPHIELLVVLTLR